MEDPLVPSPGANASDLDQPALSAGAVARQLGVAVETLRSWDRRYGLGPAAHEPGAHRRYRPSDLRRLQSFCRLLADGVPTVEAARVALHTEPSEVVSDDMNSPHDLREASDPAITRSLAHKGESQRATRAGGGNTLPVGRSGAPSARGLARCAIRLDAPGVLALLDAVIARDGVIDAWQQTIEPALRAVGRKWTETSGRYVEVEHLLSWCATVALHRVQPRPAHEAADATPARIATTRCVLLACAPEEWHSLPLEALAAALTERGAPVRMLGPAVPEPALRSAIARLGPARIVLWSQTPRTGDAGLLARLLSASGPQVLPAGPGWSAYRTKGVSVLASLAEAVEVCCQPGEALSSRARVVRTGREH